MPLSCNDRSAIVHVDFLVRKCYLGSSSDVYIANKNIQREEGSLAHIHARVIVICRPAAMVNDLEPTRPRIILRCPTRSPVDTDREPEPDFAHVHLMVPRVACICPLDEPRVECQQHPCWNVTGSYTVNLLVIALMRQVQHSKILFGIIQDSATLVLNDGIRMKLEESILQIIPTPS